MHRFPWPHWLPASASRIRRQQRYDQICCEPGQRMQMRLALPVTRSRGLAAGEDTHTLLKRDEACCAVWTESIPVLLT